MRELALILAGGRGSRLDILSENRAKPSIPFAGKFRIIDFCLSNCVNSGIYDVGILTQYLPESLNKHIGIGTPWDLDRKFGGVTLLQPKMGIEENQDGWYHGTAHAIYQNLEYIRERNPKYIVILSGDHVYKMNYRKMIKQHEETGADLTIAAQRVPMNEADRFGILDVDSNLKVVNFVEKPKNPPTNLASMGIYVFTADVLIDILEKYCNKEFSDFGHNIIPMMIQNNSVYAHEFEGYWQDVGTFDSYMETTLELTKYFKDLKLDMYDPEWRIYTRSEDLPAVKFGDGKISRNLICNGCIIGGEVTDSVLSPGVKVEKDAIVRNSIIFNDTVIKQGAVIENCIIDKNVVIGRNTKLGTGDDCTPNREVPDVLSSGITVVAKGAHVPADMVIGRNVRIFSNVREKDYDSKVVESGSSIKRK